jgi:hypothetical protein
MARRSTTARPQSLELSPADKSRAIARLERRLTELREFEPATVHAHSDPRPNALGRAIDETLTAIFGAGTVDYDRYRDAIDIDRAPIFVNRSVFGPELHSGLAIGKENAVSTLQGIINRFNEELEMAPASHNREGSATASNETRRVFVVHGHDEGRREAVARFLEQIGSNLSSSTSVRIKDER